MAKFELTRKNTERPKKQFGSGTKGRIDQHAYDCREIIKKHGVTAKLPPALALEFIADTDREYGSFDNRNWQKFEDAKDALESFKKWLEPPK